MSQNAIPAPIDDRQRRIGLIDTELKIVEREMSSGADHTARRDELTAERLRISDELAALQKRWEEERAIVTRDRRGARQHRCRPGRQVGRSRQRRKRRRRQRRPGRSRQAGGTFDAPARAAGRTAADLSRGRRSGDRRNRRRMDRHSGPPDAVRRDPHRPQPARVDGAPRHRPMPCHGSRRASHPHQPRRPDRSTPADRRLPARRHVRRRQDRNGPQPRRAALWRRAERDDDQHVGVQGRAQSQPADGLPAGLCRLWRRWRADRGGAAAALQCGAA